MSSLMWPWPERMVSGLKPTKLSWLAVVQKKAPQPSCLSWMVLILMSRKQKRQRQTGHVFGCPKFVLRMRQLKRGARGAKMLRNGFKMRNKSLFAMKSFCCDSSLICIRSTYSSSCVSCPWFEFESFWSTVGKGQFQMWLLHSWNKTEKQIMKKYVDDLVTKSVKVGYI